MRGLRWVALPRAAKYGNVKATGRTGERFDSKGEAALDGHLRTLQAAGIVSYFLRQVPFHLPGGVVYRVDFMAVYASGRITYYDYKGFETQGWKNKVKQTQALYPVQIVAVRRVRGRFEGVEIHA